MKHATIPQDALGVIAYNVKNRDDYTCLEIKTTNSFRRDFIYKGSVYYGPLQVPENELLADYKNLFSRNPIQLDVSTDLSGESLTQDLPKEAFLKSHPSLIQFSSGISVARRLFDFTLSTKILNHTDHKITVNFLGHIFVDGFGIYQTSRIWSVVAYHLMDHPELIRLAIDEGDEEFFRCLDLK